MFALMTTIESPAAGANAATCFRRVSCAEIRRMSLLSAVKAQAPRAAAPSAVPTRDRLRACVELETKGNRLLVARLPRWFAARRTGVGAPSACWPARAHDPAGRARGGAAGSPGAAKASSRRSIPAAGRYTAPAKLACSVASTRQRSEKDMEKNDSNQQKRMFYYSPGAHALRPVRTPAAQWAGG